MKRIHSERQEFEGEFLPWYYGVAWRDVNRRAYVCYPLGVNILAAFVRRLYYRLRIGLTDAICVAYDKGHDEGWQRGFKHGFKAGAEDIDKRLKRMARILGIDQEV